MFGCVNCYCVFGAGRSPLGWRAVVRGHFVCVDVLYADYSRLSDKCRCFVF